MKCGQTSLHPCMCFQGNCGRGQDLHQQKSSLMTALPSPPAGAGLTMAQPGPLWKKSIYIFLGELFRSIRNNPSGSTGNADAPRKKKYHNKYKNQVYRVWHPLIKSSNKQWQYKNRKLVLRRRLWTLWRAWWTPRQPERDDQSLHEGELERHQGCTHFKDNRNRRGRSRCTAGRASQENCAVCTLNCADSVLLCSWDWKINMTNINMDN